MTRQEKTLLWIISGIALLASGLASWLFMYRTDQGLTYWASTIGTAIGGMLAVVAAVILWQAEARAGRRQSKIDSNAKSVEVILNSTRRMKSIVRESDVYEEFGWPNVNVAVDKAITEKAAEITSAAIWIRDVKIRAELLEITNYFSANTNFMQMGPYVDYSVRIHQICSWMVELCEDLLRLEDKRGELKNRAGYADAWQEMENLYAEQDRWQEEEIAKEQAKKVQATQQQSELPAENQ